MSLFVAMITPLRTPEDTTRRIWRKPRANQANKNHIKLFWGKEYEKSILITGDIYGYNYWMIGVDWSD